MMACRVFREPGRVARARGGPFGNTGRRTGGTPKVRSSRFDDIERASDLVNAAERAASLRGAGGQYGP